MSRLTRDGTAEPVSRDQILRREHGRQGNKISPVQLTTCRHGKLTRLIHTTHSSFYMCDHTYIHTYIVVVVIVLSAREFSAASLALVFFIF